jgi:hypothetical protein
MPSASQIWCRARIPARRTACIHAEGGNMFKWSIAGSSFIAGLSLAACAESDPGSADLLVGENASELTAPPSCLETGDCPVPVPEEPGLIFCGGIAGFRCPSGMECVDDPRDDCSPCRGGADCGGICVELSCQPPKCDPNLLCTQVLTCVDGMLYPTGCGPRNCDRPIGECDPS